MNGEAMDESTEDQQNQEIVSSSTSDNITNKNDDEEEQTIPDSKIEQNAEEQLETIPTSDENANGDVPIFEKCKSQDNTPTPTNGLDRTVEQNDMINSPQVDIELESTNSCLEKLNNNKDSSILSTTDTQDEIETAANGDQIYINNINDPLEETTKSNSTEKKVLSEEIVSEDSIDDLLGSDLDPQTEETFSVVSGSEYDEVSEGSSLKEIIQQDKNNDRNTTDLKKPVTQNGTKTPEVLEIESDKEVHEDVEEINKKIEDNKKNGSNKKPVNTELRRSSRTVKRKKYSYDYNNDEESDVEEIQPEDNLRRSKPIMINDTKSLVEIAARQSSRSSGQRREPQLVLIGSNTMKSIPPKISNSMLSTSLYQSIVARGTTVTPVSSKPATTTTTQAVQTIPTPAPIMLPSLTDDMFVVEAPSFIVPYVYEKPSIEPFKEFVTKLGKEIEEQRAKAEKELLEKKKEEKAKRQMERQERKDRGEEVTDSEEETRKEEEERKKVARKERRKRRELDDDDDSWDGSDSTDSEDFKITDEKGTTILLNHKEDVGNLKDLEGGASGTTKSDNYFDCSLGKFFINIGMGLVEEYVQSDLLKQQKRKLQREKKSGQSTKEREVSISLLMKNLELSKENNEPFTCVQMKCEHCSFKTESALVLAQHLETPHMKNNLYQCNFCDFEIRSPQDILLHMQAEHNVRGRLERAPSYHQCVNCTFEDNGKGKLARHLIACAKKYKPEQNLSPPVEWEPPAKIPKVAKARQTMLGAPFPQSGHYGRPQMNSFGKPPMIGGVMPGMSNYRPRARLPGPAMQRPVMAGGSIVRGSSMLRHNSPQTIANYSVNKKNHPSISITPLPRQTAPPQLPGTPNTKGTFVICEICDGYIKDLDQLRNHMQWIHKVKIHPKMIYNRPPLNCQKCQFRFFTDQGLERHLLGSHGLVTSSMQEAANKSKDAGRCPVCGKVYQWKLLNHVARDHNVTLKPAHLSYKCTVCTATFGMYKLFENHVYSAHSVVAKRVMDKAPAKAKNNAPKGLKINDEITITAQPAKAAKEK